MKLLEGLVLLFGMSFIGLLIVNIWSMFQQWQSLATNFIVLAFIVIIYIVKQRKKMFEEIKDGIIDGLKKEPVKSKWQQRLDTLQKANKND